LKSRASNLVGRHKKKISAPTAFGDESKVSGAARVSTYFRKERDASNARGG